MNDININNRVLIYKRFFDFGGKRFIIAFTITVLALFYFVFLLFPIVYAFVGSFFHWNPMNGQFDYAGVENYADIFKNELLWKSLFNTIYFTTVVVVLRTVIGLMLAILINSTKRFKSFFRMAYFIPVITSIVAVSLVWKWLYNPAFGAFNFVLALLHLPTLNWLQDPVLALPCIMVATIWKDVGYAIVIFMAGLAGIPNMLYEAAYIDGADKIKSFRHITLPLIRPTTLFVLVTSLISYLQAFTQIFMMTEKGGPGTSCFTMVYLIYNEAFTKYQFGVSSSISFVLFVIILIFSMIQIKVMRSDWGY